MVDCAALTLGRAAFHLPLRADDPNLACRNRFGFYPGTHSYSFTYTHAYHNDCRAGDGADRDTQPDHSASNASPQRDAHGDIAIYSHADASRRAHRHANTWQPDAQTRGLRRPETDRASQHGIVFRLGREYRLGVAERFHQRLARERMVPGLCFVHRADWRDYADGVVTRDALSGEKGVVERRFAERANILVEHSGHARRRGGPVCIAEPRSGESAERDVQVRMEVDANDYLVMSGK